MAEHWNHAFARDRRCLRRREVASLSVEPALSCQLRKGRSRAWSLSELQAVGANPITSVVRLAARSVFLPRLLPEFAGVLWSAVMPSTNTTMQAKRLHAKARQHSARRLPELRSATRQLF